MIKRIVVAAIILYVYYIHLPTLRLLGPRCAVMLSGLMAWVHWLGTFAGLNLGGEKKALPALAALLPTLQPGLSPRSALRKLLAVRHRTLIEYSLLSSRRGQRYVQRNYYFDGREHLDAAVKEGKGGRPGDVPLRHASDDPPDAQPARLRGAHPHRPDGPLPGRHL
jgi:hypothetical protein